MFKSAKIWLIKSQFRTVMPHLIIANAAIYNAPADARARPQSAIGHAAAAIARARNEAVANGNPAPLNGRDPEAWMQTGMELWNQITDGNDVNVVCDTCSGLGLYILQHQSPGFYGRVELVADLAHQHHFLVIDREDVDINAMDTWGPNCFIVDLWSANIDHDETNRGPRFGVEAFGDEIAHHYLHGIYRNPGEHHYSTQAAVNQALRVDNVFDITVW